MALDFTRLNDAIGKVADLAKSHADVSALVLNAQARAAAAEGALVDGQKAIDALVEQLVAAASTPVEKVGLEAVAAALYVAPAPDVTVAPVDPVAAPAVDATGAVVAAVPAVAPVAPALAPVNGLALDPVSIR